MREAINNNPMVQIGLLGVLGVIVAVVFMSSSGGDAAPAPEDAATATATEGTVPAPAESGLADPTAPPAEGAVPPPAAATTPFEAGKGLPADLVDAHASGDVVVLLVMQKNGYEDEPLARDVESLESRGDTSVFVTESKDVSDYSRIAEGVTLDRVPAIIVLHPLEGKVADGEDLPMPNATVTYGYRGKESVTTAVEDALYDGKQLSYDPG